MAISPLYIPLFTIEEVILDKDSGLPLSGGIVTFFRDSQRTQPKPVYQITGSSPSYTFTSVGNTLVLGIAGDFVDTNGNPFVPYAYPFDDAGNVDLYYVTVESAGNVDQFVRQAVPYLGEGIIPANELGNTENLISNPQFAEVLFPSLTSFVLTVTGSNTVSPIAPGWDLISSGSGTITLERLEPTAAGVITNPPYALSITASLGLGSAITLRQRFNNSPSILRGEFASASITAAVLSGGASAISMVYAPSTGSSTSVINSTNIPTDGAYHVIAANNAIPDQSNSAAGVGYIDIDISIPTSRTIAITSIQLVGAAFAVDIPFDQQTSDRQIDHLFHYYKDPLARKPIPSYLVGWDFLLNPVQHGTAFGPTAGANSSFYCWDQTIYYQSITSGIMISFASQGLGLSASSTTQTAIIQYLTAAQAQQLLSGKISVNIHGYAVTASTLGVKTTVSLWATTDVSLPSTVGGNLSLVDTLDANGKPATFHGTWQEVTPLNGLDNTFILKDYINYPFDGKWDNNALSSSATFFAIVIGTATITAGDSIIFNSVSLQAGEIATIPAPQTFDQVLRECQYYYEKSYDVETSVGTVTNANATTVEPSNAVTAMVGMDRPFKVNKYIAPTVTWYSPSTGTAARIYNIAATADATVSSNSYVGKNSTGIPVLSAPITGGDRLVGHWTADARLGQ